MWYWEVLRKGFILGGVRQTGPINKFVLKVELSGLTTWMIVELLQFNLISNGQIFHIGSKYVINALQSAVPNVIKWRV